MSGSLPEYYYQVFIESDDPDRYLPACWNIIAISDSDAVMQANRLAAQEKVKVTKIVDDRGRKID